MKNIYNTTGFLSGNSPIHAQGKYPFFKNFHQITKKPGAFSICSTYAHGKSRLISPAALLLTLFLALNDISPQNYSIFTRSSISQEIPKKIESIFESPSFTMSNVSNAQICGFHIFSIYPFQPSYASKTDETT